MAWADTVYCTEHKQEVTPTQTSPSVSRLGSDRGRPRPLSSNGTMRERSYELSNGTNGGVDDDDAAIADSVVMQIQGRERDLLQRG